MRPSLYIFMAFFAVAAIFGMVRENHSALSVVRTDVAKIHRCAVENFMMEHKILYHVTPSRYDVASLTMLCLSDSTVQPDLLASN